MSLATLPPTVEIREMQTATAPSLRSTYWAMHEGVHERKVWRQVAFSQIANFERQAAPDNTFQVSEAAAAQMRLLMAVIDIESLPIPTIAPISGHGIFAEWNNSSRAIEITVFADGESVLEALEDRIANEDLSRQPPNALLTWLVSGSLAANATAR